MKGIVYLMIIVMLAAAFFILNAGGGEGKTFFGAESAYCTDVAEQKRIIEESGDFNIEYKGRFRDFLHGCW